MTTWAQAAQTVADRWAKAGKPLAVPPDDPNEDDRQFWLEVQKLVGGTREASYLRLREDYDPSEPRDDRGEWTSGGGGANALAMVGNTGPGSTYDPERQAAVQVALSDALARSPELATGAGAVRPLGGIEYMSAADLGNFKQATSNAELYGPDGEAYRALGAIDAAAVTYPGVGGMAPDYEHTPSVIVVNDLTTSGISSETAPSTQNSYGMMTHEIGHAYFDSRGVDSQAAAAALLNANGIGPQDVAPVSMYAASAPQEALAEMYSMKYTPGYSLPSDLAPKFDAVEQSVKGASGYSWTGGAVWHGTPLAGTLAEARMVAAAKTNIAAGRWLVDGSDEPDFNRVAEAVSRMREDYNPDEPRDDQGRWTSGGGGDTYAPKSYADARAAAERNHGPYDRIVQGAAAKVDGGARSISVPIKGEPRATEKVGGGPGEGKYGGDWSRLGDMVRGSVIVQTDDQIPGAIDAVRNEAEAQGWRVEDVENRYDPQTGPTVMGYRDASMHLIAPDGMTTELQINTESMQAAKDGPGHALYEAVRGPMERANAGGPPLTDAESAMIVANMQQQQDLYNTAYAAGHRGSG